MKDIVPGMGGVVGYPGSHKEGPLPVNVVNNPGSINQDPNATREELVLPDGYKRKYLEMKKGSVLFMHSHFVHGSERNVSNQLRQALLMTYIRQGVKFRPGNTAHREEVEVYDRIK